MPECVSRHWERHTSKPRPCSCQEAAVARFETTDWSLILRAASDDDEGSTIALPRAGHRTEVKLRYRDLADRTVHRSQHAVPQRVEQIGPAVLDDWDSPPEPNVGQDAA